MPLLQLCLLIFPLAFVSGFALQKGKVCSVLAAKQIVETGEVSRFVALGWGGLWAMAVILPLAWLQPDAFQVSAVYPATFITILAGMMYGAGAFLNGACLFGICSRAVSGSVHFLAAIPGVALGGTMARVSGLLPDFSDPTSSMLAEPTMVAVGIAVAATFAAVLTALRVTTGLATSGMTFRQLVRAKRWRTSMAMVVIGLTQGIAFAANQTWSYASLFRQVSGYIFGITAEISPVAIVGTIGLFAGANAAQYFDGRFHFARPTMSNCVRSFAGGLVMGFSATFIPGGNDVMLLYAGPSLAIHAIVAYVAMFATLIGLAWLSRWRRMRVGA
jgi:uncharacterized protein